MSFENDDLLSTAGTPEELLSAYAQQLAEDPQRGYRELGLLREIVRIRRDELLGATGGGAAPASPTDREAWLEAYFDPGCPDTVLGSSLRECSVSEAEQARFSNLLFVRPEWRRANRDPEIDRDVLEELSRQLRAGPLVTVLHPRPAGLQAAALLLKARYPGLGAAAAVGLDRIAAAEPSRPAFDRPVPKPKWRPPRRRRRRIAPLPNRTSSGSGWGFTVLVLVGGLIAAFAGSSDNRSRSRYVPPELPDWPRVNQREWETPRWELPPDLRYRKPLIDEETRKLIERLRKLSKDTPPFDSEQLRKLLERDAGSRGETGPERDAGSGGETGPEADGGTSEGPERR